MALKFDTREPGMVLSGVAHVALLGAALFAATSRPLPPAEEGIPVEVITENQLSEITKGETTAKVALPDPKPRAERQADVRVERDPGEAPKDVPSPPTRPAEVKVADEPVEAAAAPPPPPPPPARPPEKTPEPPKREAEKQPDPTPVPQPPRRQDVAAVETDDAEALAKAEAQKARAEAQAKAAAQAKAKAEADAKRLAEAEEKAKAKAEAEARAKQMADLKAKADAKAKAEAEARAKKQAELAEKFNPGDISRLLQSREAPQSSGSAAREVQKTASLGTAAGTAQRLNPSQRDALMGLLRDQLHRCWQAPLAATTSDKPPVPSVRVKLNQDGSLAAEPAVVNSSGDPLFRVVADSATRATRRCAPLRIPAQFQPYYQDWKDLVVNFDPREMG